MLQMVVNSIGFLGSFCALGKLFGLSSFVGLSYHRSSQFYSCSFIVLNNFRKLQALLILLVFSIFVFGFLDVITLGLHTMEANSFYAFHIAVWLSISLWEILYETDHGFIASHVESILTFRAQFVQPSVIFIMDQVAIIGVLKGILKVRDESKAVFKLNEERLSVDW